jgi:hypothetical protein
MSSAPLPARLTTTAWSPQRQLTAADWVRQGRWLGALGRASGWWIGDWLRYGNVRYGERYGPAARVTGYDVQSLRNMAYVAGRFERPRRRESLSFSHHAELAGLAPDEQDLWLDRAEAGAWSVGSLRSELRCTRRRAESRAALAEARRQRDKAPASRQSHGAAFDRELEASGSVHRPPAAARTRPDVGPVGETNTRGASGVVCPECGHHFDPSGNREITHPGHPAIDSSIRAPGSRHHPLPTCAPA